MANFSITAPADLASQELIVQSSSYTLSHLYNISVGSYLPFTDFSDNGNIFMSGMSSTTFYNYSITKPSEFTKIRIRPTIGQIYPKNV